MFKQVIYYFMAVVEEGSFSKAAKKYYLSQSAISQQITKLEKDLGFSLFNRKTYCPTLTKEGKRYYDLAKRLIDDYNNEYEDIKENLQKDVLTIGITGPFEKQHIPFIVRSFKENHDVSIDIKAFNLLTCMEKLNEREIDLGFGLTNNFKKYPDLIYQTIHHSHICVVTSLEHPLSHKEYLTIEDIKNEPLIILSKKQGEEYYHDYMESFRLDGMIPYIKKEVDDLRYRLINLREIKIQNSSLTQKIKRMSQTVWSKASQAVIDEKMWIDIEVLMVEIYPDIVKALRDADLSFSEMHLCFLTLFKLDTKAMSTLLNIIPTSVDKTRLRVRKKLHWEGKQDFYESLIHIKPV